MNTRTAILALFGMWGVCTALPTTAQDVADEAVVAETGELENPLLNKVWLRADADPSLPGPMQIFLADGTLISDSCWETYRLSRWEQVSDSAIRWDEDGMTIDADIASLTDDELVLNLKLGAEVQEQRFITASVPYVCPDMVK